MYLKWFTVLVLAAEVTFQKSLEKNMDVAQISLRKKLL